MFEDLQQAYFLLFFERERKESEENTLDVLYLMRTMIISFKRNREEEEKAEGKRIATEVVRGKILSCCVTMFHLHMQSIGTVEK